MPLITVEGVKQKIKRIVSLRRKLIVRTNPFWWDVAAAAADKCNVIELQMFLQESEYPAIKYI